MGLTLSPHPGDKPLRPGILVTLEGVDLDITGTFMIEVYSGFSERHWLSEIWDFQQGLLSRQSLYWVLRNPQIHFHWAMKCQNVEKDVEI